MAILPSAVVSAHANLVSSDPERGASLTKAPAVITLVFTEPLDPALSQMQLFDVHGKVIVSGPGTIDPATPTIMTLKMPATLPDGAYTAVWQTHSAADGHFANGSVAFSVGTNASNVSLLPPETASIPNQAIPALPEIILRWAGYLAAALLGGALFTDGQLFFWISNGLPRTAMPNFSITLRETQRWDLVNFIRTLAQPGAHPTVAPTAQPTP